MITVIVALVLIGVGSPETGVRNFEMVCRFPCGSPMLWL